MAIICDMAKGRLADCRYFLEIVYDWIKTVLMTKKVANSYIQMVLIVCIKQLQTNKKIISVSYVTDGVFWLCITILWLVHNRN